MASPATTPDIDAMFADIDRDDFFNAMDDSVPDLEAIRRKAAAKHASTLHEIMPSSSPPVAAGNGDRGTINGDGSAEQKGRGREGEKIERRKVPKLDEGRLLGANGFPQLIADTKHFKPKGKGHETEDLKKLFNIYSFWTHHLFPKTPFKDTVDKIEKICHSRRMNVALSVWRDESKGIIKPEDELGVVDLTSDLEHDGTPPQSPTSTRAPDVPVTTTTSQSQPLFVPDANEDEEMWDVIDEIEQSAGGGERALETIESAGADGVNGMETGESITDIPDSEGTGDSNSHIIARTSTTESASAGGGVYGDDWDDMYI